ncbi:hypothetical protein MBEHAL_0461 [Halarchaeum acidiphilum MH1-52-1]|uniref:histidine kinase n=1 Tax=Halarchaeum acidiphilum MH1-52-1 TaxID=1261545 RepID=U2YDE7_9EURY|nr:HAMP domain-containing sensor histidine kinase [Halarchaeum acidiphilum]GAD51701.1 hypothetical protein MBEHAL_0461 [Halarchaeum acidiphilum MH1-52-1]
MDDPAPVLDGAFDAAADPIALLDADGVLVTTNDRWDADAHFGVDASPGVDYAAAIEDAAPDVAAALRTVLADGGSSSVAYDRAVDGVRRRYRFRAATFDAGGERYIRVEHRDVTEHAAARRALRERESSLRASAAVLSHDLRNHFTVASGWLDMLPDADVEGRTPKARVADAIERADSAIIDAVAYLRVGRAGVARDDLDLDAIARAAWTRLDAASSDATLDVRDSDSIVGDADLLGDALERLFENAIDHAAGPEDAVTVRVGGFRGDDESGFYVADDGPGIPSARRDGVFTLGETAVEAGTGYGLPVVGRIAHVHGWDARIGEADTGGARIEFVTDPRAPTPPDRRDPRLTGP